MTLTMGQTQTKGGRSRDSAQHSCPRLGSSVTPAKKESRDSSQPQRSPAPWCRNGFPLCKEQVLEGLVLLTDDYSDGRGFVFYFASSNTALFIAWIFHVPDSSWDHG